MQGKIRIAASIMFACLSLASALAYGKELERAMEEKRTQSLERWGSEVVSLACASEELQAGETISIFNTEMRDWVSELAPKGAYVSLDDIMGLELTSAVAEGQVLTNLDFESDSEALSVPSGFVALNLSNAESLGVFDAISADKLFAYKIGSNSAELISAQVKVIDSSALESEQKLCIAVKVEDAAPLLSAQAEGKLRFVVPADDVLIVPKEDEAPAADASELPSKDEDTDKAAQQSDSNKEAEGNEN